MESEFVTLAEARRLTGLSESTVTRLGDSGEIQIYRTQGGHRRYKRSDLIEIRGGGETKKRTAREVKFIIYARVSSKKQSDDLDRQIDMLRDVYDGYELITDIASGLNFSRPGLRKILDMLLRGTQVHLAVAHKDRLARFGYELIEYLVLQNGGDVSYEDASSAKSKDEELAEDLLAIIQVFNSRANGRRRNKKQNREIGLSETDHKEDEVEINDPAEESD